jgi:HAE1 family hydrophobic/amphiphilic exporter-1
MALLAALVLGTIAWTRIPLELLPSSLEFNGLWAWVPYQDSTPEENESQLLSPLEDHLSTTPGLKELNAEARSDGAGMFLRFHRSIDMSDAYNGTVDRMERAMAELPDDVDRYYVYKWNPSDDPIMWAGMSIPTEVEDDHKLAHEVFKKRLERVPGVAKVDVWGADPKRVFIDFDRDLVFQHGLDLGQVIGTLSSDNFQMASGRIFDDGRIRYLRSLARWETPKTLAQHPVGNGVVLEDVAEIRFYRDLSANISRMDGEDGGGLAIYKESDANTTEVTEEVEAAFKDLASDPASQGSTFVPLYNQGKLIQESIDHLVETAMWGGGFALIVLLAFLRDWRMTLLIALAMPFTLLVTVTILYFTGRSLNALSLMGLMLAVGMVVDNAIVVVEAIQARRQEGEPIKESAISGTADVNLAITMSTLTTMVVFLPIILMSQDAEFSVFLNELGLPVVWALMASLLVALGFAPLASTLFQKSREGPEGEQVDKPPPRWITWLISTYKRWLNRLLTRRTDSLMWGLIAVVLTFALPFQSVGCQDGEGGNLGDFRVSFEVPSNFPYCGMPKEPTPDCPEPETSECGCADASRVAVVGVMEDWVDQYREEWGVKTTRTWLGGSDSHGNLSIYLEQEREDDMPSREEVIDLAREVLPTISGVQIKMRHGDQRGPPPHQIQITLWGNDTETLMSFTEDVEEVLSQVPGVVGVHGESGDSGYQEIQLNVNRDATRRHGLSAERIGRTISFSMRGVPLPDYTTESKEIDVIARFKGEDRADLNRLLDFPMWSMETMSAVPLRTVVDQTIGQGRGEIHRKNQQTGAALSIDLATSVDMETMRARVGAALSAMEFPQGISFDDDMGRMDEQADMDAQIMALTLSICFVFLIMGVLFESFILPLSILTTIPLSLFGVYWTLYLTNTPLDSMAAIGLIILIGVVVNNGIVLIDLVTRLRREGMQRLDALIEGGSRRLRPILMTALTTICGLMPMAAGTATFIGIPYAPLGRVVVGGLVAGTILTLFFVPFMYTVLDDIRGSTVRWAAWIRGRPPTSTVPSEASGASGAK